VYEDMAYIDLLGLYTDLSQLVADLKKDGVHDCARMARLDTMREELVSRNSKWIDDVMKRRQTNG
jgi:hypothetical protein